MKESYMMKSSYRIKTLPKIETNLSRTVSSGIPIFNSPSSKGQYKERIPTLNNGLEGMKKVIMTGKVSGMGETGGFDRFYMDTTRSRLALEGGFTSYRHDKSSASEQKMKIKTNESTNYTENLSRLAVTPMNCSNYIKNIKINGPPLVENVSSKNIKAYVVVYFERKDDEDLEKQVY